MTNYGNEYSGIETSDSIITAIEEKYNGRACDEGSDAWLEWSDPKNINEIVLRAWEIEFQNDNEKELFWGVENFLMAGEEAA